MNVTWAPLLLGLMCAVVALSCAGAALRGRRLPALVRVLLAVLAVPLAAYAFVATAVGLGFSGR